MKISIVTPSYNQGRFIERALKSVADQKGVNFEHVICDGGSTDNTIEILKNFSPSIRWISEKDKGQTDAVNKGISTTDGEIIGWLNSDDVYYPGAISRVVTFFKANSDIDVVYGMADYIDINDRILEPYPTEPWDFQRLKDTCFICQPAVFFRRKVIERFGLLDESLQFCMDYEFWLRLAREGAAFAYIPEVLAGSRMYPENKTLSKRVAVHAEINNMMVKKFGKVPAKWIFAYAHVLVDGWGVPRGTPKFVSLVAWHSILASFQWNHGIPKEIFQAVRTRFIRV